MKHRFGHVVIVSLLVVGLAGCAAVTRKTYVEHSFPGIRNFSTSDAPLSLLFIHGMGGFSKSSLLAKEEDPLPAIRHIAKSMGLTLRKGPCRDIIKPPPDDDKVDCLRGCLDQWDLVRCGKVRIRAYALHWKPTTQFHTCALHEADQAEPLKRMRPRVTQRAKNWMNKTIGDVVLYAGLYRSAIKRTTECALRVVEQDLESHPKGAIIPITFSLGSTVLFDTLEDMRSASGSEASLAARVPVVYMLANQLRFLELANKNPGCICKDCLPRQETDRRSSVLKSIAGARQPGEPTWFVGITDPSDLLSWPLTPDLACDGAVLVNAYHTVARSSVLIPTQGALGNPYTAHVGYGANKQVLHWILNGHNWN